jgi:hypothetical protein
LSERYSCPVVYFSGALGGLIKPPSQRLKDERGAWLGEGNFAFAKQYGFAVADLAQQACQNAKPINLTPLRISAAKTGVPMTNELYRLARMLGVLRRDGYAWNGDHMTLGPKIQSVRSSKDAAIETEVACLRLGELYVALLPGELYPELVRGEVEDPPQAGVDFPESPPEPSLTSILPNDSWMFIGLANDEIGYIIPRRQWDRSPPFAYGRSSPQYGEINSCSPDVAATVMHALQERVAEVQQW